MKKLNYYIFASYRRKMLDEALKKNSNYFKGKILDIGGGKKDGIFLKPRTHEWIIVDIDKKSKPDIVASVEKLPFKNNTFDVVKATELFEHVENLEKGFSECSRVLKGGGSFIISTPFMYPLHSDPYDFQRITVTKLESMLKKNKFKIKTFEEQGYYFTLTTESVRALIINCPFFIRYFLYLFLPILDIIKSFDSFKIIKNSKFFKNYVGGYFVIAEKI